MQLSICLLLFAGALRSASCLTHETTLMWTLKSLSDGSVDVRGVPGDPDVWVKKGIDRVSNSFFSDPTSRQISRRLALAFQYSTRRVFFSDQGFKEIFRIVLETAPNSNATVIYSVPIEVVYGGISTQVNGMAMDWASGSLYWTDALYNWITVANASDYNMAKHIVYTGRSRPMGIAVYPQKGYLFWSSIGAVPKIERSTLDGDSRINFVDSDIDRPLGLSVDYKAGHLYWIDDLRDTVERVSLDDPTSRWTMPVGSRHSLTGKLFGLAVFKDFIFATDQLYMSIDVFNKSSGLIIKNFTAAVAEGLPKGIPYDILMYDSSLQEEIDSDCRRLRCSDICISDGGKKAHCSCQEGSSLSLEDMRTCIENATFRMPQYLYSIGEALCGIDVIAADQEFVPTEVRCFYNVSGHQMVALGFNVYEGFLFFSDQSDRVIHRMTLSNSVNSSAIDVIVANIGYVSGLVVDWIADNLYWTDEDRGVLMVSRVTGRYAKVLLQGLDRPQSVAVNPLNGTLYWATPDKIYIANMDGTNARILINIPGSQFDGMVLDIRADLLLWVDQSLPGIRSCRMNGSNLAVVLRTDVRQNMTLLDVTVYQNYIAWTNGLDSVYLGIMSSSNTSLANILRGVKHAAAKTSHDIITYDTYLQPPLEPGKVNPCDIDNDVHGCSQLCLLTPSGSQCACSAGFVLVDNYCVSEPLTRDFLLFVDPYSKIAYQYDLNPRTPSSANVDGSENGGRLRGISLRSGNLPSLVAYDYQLQEIFWFDEDRLKNSVKQISIFEVAHFHTVSTLDKAMAVRRIEAVDNYGDLLLTDSATGSVFLMSLENPNDLQKLVMENVYESAIAVDECTGEIYWTDGLTNDINRCNLTESCFSNSAVEFSTVFNSWTGNTILGMNIVQNDEEKTLIVWTENEIHSLRNGHSSLLLTVNDSFSLSGAVMADNIVYFTSAFHNAIFQYDTKTKSTRVTVGGFSEISDLKLFLSPCTNGSYTNAISLHSSAPYTNASYTNAPPTESAVQLRTDKAQLGSGAIAGIVIGAIVFLLLLILLIILLVVLLRRRRDKRAAETAAYSNPGYDRLSSIASTLSHMPDGAEGFSPYDGYDNNNEGDKKDSALPPSYDDLYFSDEAIAAVGIYDGYLYTKESPDCEKKSALPFPEVSAVDPAIFLVGAAGEAAESKPPTGDQPWVKPRSDVHPGSLPKGDDAAHADDRNGSSRPSNIYM